MKWRRVLRTLHRDLGYFCVGLTVIYAVSGIAVNHRRDWDFNLSKHQESRPVGDPAALLGVPADADPGQLARDRQDELVARLVQVLGREQAPRKAFWRGPDRLSLFFGKGGRDVIDYLPSQGVAELTVASERFLFRDMNYLHLNEGGGAWTWIADAFALLLIFLAISGTLIVKGRRGLRGRGGIYVAAGIVLPVIALIAMR